MIRGITGLRRLRWVAAAGVLLVLGVGVALVVGLTGPADMTDDPEGGLDGGAAVSPAAIADLALARADARPDGRSEPAPAMAFAPDPVTHTPKKAAPRRPRPRTHTARRPSGPTAAGVQRKFQAVWREYQAFVRAYGHQLDGQWQKILFAHTYGSKDRAAYRKLNGMLDRLRRQMKKVKGR